SRSVREKSAAARNRHTRTAMKPSVLLHSSLGENNMKSPIEKRSIVIGRHKTSVSLEDAFWQGLKEIAHDRKMTLAHLIASIDSERQQGNLASAIRLFVLSHYRDHNGERMADRDTASETRAFPQ